MLALGLGCFYVIGKFVTGFFKRSARLSSTLSRNILLNFFSLDNPYLSSTASSGNPLKAESARASEDPFPIDLLENGLERVNIGGY